MKVSSPIGELPFTPKALRLRKKAFELDGEMGAWPAKVEISFSDLPALLKVMAWLIGLIVVVIAAIVAVVVALTNLL
jgi:hypothetical protein